jgi:hypothetical protein
MSGDWVVPALLFGGFAVLWLLIVFRGGGGG